METNGSVFLKITDCNKKNIIFCLFILFLQLLNIQSVQRSQSIDLVTRKGKVTLNHG